MRLRDSELTSRGRAGGNNKVRLRRVCRRSERNGKRGNEANCASKGSNTRYEHGSISSKVSRKTLEGTREDRGDGLGLPVWSVVGARLIGRVASRSFVPGEDVQTEAGPRRDAHCLQDGVIIVVNTRRISYGFFARASARTDPVECERRVSQKKKSRNIYSQWTRRHALQ